MGIYQGNIPLSGGGNGKTPFEIAQENGYLGTEIEFNNGLTNVVNIEDIENQLNNLTAADLNATLSKAVVNNSDLIAWANSQTTSCHFIANPSIVAANVPVVGKWYVGILSITNGGKSIFMITLNDGRAYYNYTNAGNFMGWNEILTTKGGSLIGDLVATGNDYTHWRVRSIAAHTDPVTPGVTALGTGDIYLQFE
jgi:hypothetical protein